MSNAYVLTAGAKTDSSPGESVLTALANQNTQKVVLTSQRPGEGRYSDNLKSPQIGQGLGWRPPPLGASIPCEGVSRRIEL